jgi:hypothetical protein
MMPRIEAGEQLAAINRAALSNNIGFENELDRQRAFDALRQRATGEGPRAAAKADPADLAMMGIGVSNAAELPTIGDVKEWLDHG